MGNKKMAKDLQGPILAPGQSQSNYAPVFLNIFKEIIQDKNYVDRLKKHYSMFREVIKKKEHKNTSSLPKNKTLQKYLRNLEEEYDIILTEENYEQVILKELGEPESLLDYFRDYMKTNKDILSIEWACLMVLVILAYDDMYVPDIEKYYKLLKKYPANGYIEHIMGEIYLRYYGNLFKARDKFEVTLNLRQKDPHSHYELGFLYHLLGIFNKSCEHYEKAILYAEYGNLPNEIKARSLYNIATAKINIEQNYKEGRKLLEDALISMPDYSEARDALNLLPGYKEEKNNTQGGNIINEIKRLFRRT